MEDNNKKPDLVDQYVEGIAEAMAKLPWRGWDEIEVTEEDLKRVDELMTNLPPPSEEK